MKADSEQTVLCGIDRKFYVTFQQTLLYTVKLSSEYDASAFDSMLKHKDRLEFCSLHYVVSRCSAYVLASYSEPSLTFNS